MTKKTKAQKKQPYIEPIQLYAVLWTELKKYLVATDKWAKEERAYLDFHLAEYLRFTGQQYRRGGIVEVMGRVYHEDIEALPAGVMVTSGVVEFTKAIMTAVGFNSPYAHKFGVHSASPKIILE